MMKGIIDMKIQQRMKVVLLLSFFISTPLCAEESAFVDEKARSEELLLAEKFIIRDIREDVKSLLKKKDRDLVDSNIFGDCIHSYLSTDNKDIINASVVIPKLTLLFDSKFMSVLDDLKIGDNLFLYDKETLNPADYKDKYENMIQIMVNIREDGDDENFTKTYWFYKKNGRWIFAGMTCIG